MQTLEEQYYMQLDDRGLLDGNAPFYAQLLDELTAFLPLPDPNYWHRTQLERFLKQRSPSLSTTELEKCGVALGILTELIESPHVFNYDPTSPLHTLGHADTQPLLSPRQRPANDDREQSDFLAEHIAQWSGKHPE